MEYWSFVLINILISIGLSLVDVMMGWMIENDIGVLSTVYSIFVFIPGLAVAVRRLHDINKSGWWILIAFVPILGWILIIVWSLMPGNPGSNDYGPDPKA
jgi:uncharacterized membrane protein YhaH (DUF805 family)